MCDSSWRLFAALLGAASALIGILLELTELWSGEPAGEVSSCLIFLGVVAVVLADLRIRCA